jgi:uncharacterized protein
MTPKPLPRLHLRARNSPFAPVSVRAAAYALWAGIVVCVVALALGLASGPSGAAQAAQTQNPQQLQAQGYVNDYANVLSQSARDKLTALCTEVDQKAQAQIAVVTVKSLGGRPIEDYSIDLATHLGVGPKKTDRGVMILLAVDDHRYRFEVGYGLEGILPDGKVGGFGRDAVPYLRQNNYDAAVLLMTRDVADVIAADRGVTLTPWPEATAPEEEPGLKPSAPPAVVAIGGILLLLFILILVGSLFSRPRGPYRRGGGWWIGPMMGGFGGGGFGGGGWGGGSWGGGGGGGSFGGFGGGSFGGGGASGSW